MAWNEPSGYKRSVRISLIFRGILLASGAVMIMAACGSSGGHAPSTKPARPNASTPASRPAPSDKGSPANAATTAAIGKAYAIFFDSTSTTAQSAATLQHGSKFLATLKEQAKSSYAATSSAQLDSARLVSPQVAAVTFTIRSGGSVMLAKVPGYAVQTGGRWQVAARTFCSLLTLQGDAPAACADPGVTALPD